MKGIPLLTDKQLREMDWSDIPNLKTSNKKNEMNTNEMQKETRISQIFEALDTLINEGDEPQTSKQKEINILFGELDILRKTKEMSLTKADNEKKKQKQENKESLSLYAIDAMNSINNKVNSVFGLVRCIEELTLEKAGKGDGIDDELAFALSDLAGLAGKEINAIYDSLQDVINGSYEC
jgi:hypothetical protein